MGGQEFPAKVLGYDEDRDVAVLQLVFGDGEPVSSCLTACTHQLCGAPSCPLHTIIKSTLV